MDKKHQVRARLLSYIRLDKRYLIIAMVCAVVSAVLEQVPALLSKYLIDSMNAGDQHMLSLVCIGIAVVYTIKWFFTYGQMVYFAEAGQRLALRLRNEIFTHLQGLSLRYFNRQRTGALMSTMLNDVPVLQSSITSLKDIAPAPFKVLIGLIVIFAISWQLSLAVIVAVPIMALTVNWLTRQIKQITIDTQDKLSDVSMVMEETLSGIRITQSFSAEQHEIRRFNRENTLAKKLIMKGTRRQAALKPSIDVIGAIGISIALFYGGHLVVNHTITTGMLTAFLITVNQIAVGINNLGSIKVTLDQVNGAGERILDNVLNVESDIQDRPNAVALETVEGLVQFKDVYFAYNEETPVLSGVNFTINPGELVAVVGPTGAGKSTISDLIPRFYDPDRGAILIDGHDVRDVTLISLRKHIGIVPQETMLFGGTIRDNIVYGNPLATDEMVVAAACAANAHEFISDPRILADGYATIVGERGKQLSGGQRQRVAIARALLKDPKILILDEATSSLDASSEMLVQEALELLMKGRTTLVIAHRLSTVVNADKILVLDKGAIVESGTHTELINRPGGVYARLYETQFRREGDVVAV